MASIRKVKLKSGRIRYRVRIRVKGVYRSKSFRAKAQAEHWGADQEREIYRAGMSSHEQAKERTVWDMVKRYYEEVLLFKARGSQRAQYSRLIFWCTFLGEERPIIQVTPSVISEAKRELASSRKEGTVNGYLAVLSHMFTMAVKEWQWAEINPVRNVFRLPEPPGRVRFLSERELDRLVMFCKCSSNPNLYAAVLLGIFTGCRRTEIWRLTWAQVDLRRGFISLDETKNRDRRTVRLAGEALEELRRLCEVRNPVSEYCFSAKDENRPADLRYAWETARRRARISDFHFHDLRHTAASYLAMTGATLQEIADILGQRTLAMAKRYSHLTDSHKHQVVERMNKSIPLRPR